MKRVFLLLAVSVVSLAALGQDDRGRDSRSDGLVIIRPRHPDNYRDHERADIQRHIDNQIRRHMYRGHAVHVRRNVVRDQIRFQMREERRMMRKEIRKDIRHGRRYWRHS